METTKEIYEAEKKETIRRANEIKMEKDNYPTPKWLKDCYKDWYDPCPLNPNFEIDGLKQDWENKTYVNPPYSNPLSWVKKAIEEMNKGKLIVMLLRCDTSTEAFRLCHQYGEVLFFAHRIKFNGRTPYFASMLVIFNLTEEDLK